MKIDVDLDDSLFDEACRLTGMCCACLWPETEKRLTGRS